MQTKYYKTLSAQLGRICSILMILSLLLSGVGIRPAHAATFTISGNAGVAGATITFSGTGGGTTTSDSSGNYSKSITVSFYYSGTATPSKVGYTFSPSSRNYIFVTSSQTNQNFTATVVTYTISGSTGSAGAGATITYTGGSTIANGTTGNYSFTVSYGWSGTVTPSKTGYDFTPTSRSYTNVTANQTSQNYTAVSTMHTISGNVGTGSAILSYTDGTPKTATANGAGVYTFQVTNNWSGTVTPSKTGFTFSPTNKTYTNVIADQTAQNYTARPTVFSFASMADTQMQVAYFSATVNQISTLSPSLVIFNGDLEDAGVVSTEMNPMINALKTANLFNNTFLVRGNHDDQVSGSAALWENYFETAPNIKVLPAYVTNYVSLNSDSDYLTYSFEYGNSIFIGLDVPGDIDNLTTAEMDFLNSRLTYAEGQGLTHAFIFFHGPEYCVESTHCLCPTRTDGGCTPPSLMTIFNNHPIVSATFHGHEHVLGWTHMDSTRVAELTRSYEQFITSPAGDSTYNEYLFPDRMDYTYPDMENSQGFATISVDGNSFTYRIYKVGTTQPVWSHTFSKINSVPTISDITDKITDEDIATGDISFTIGDVETPAAFLTVTASSSNSALVPDGIISLGGTGTNRTINITPAPNQNGTTTITVTVNDGSAATASDTFLLTVNAVNDAPVADAQSVSLPWNTFLDITLTGTDVEGSPLTYIIVDAPAHGGLSGSGANQTYTPTLNYSGPDSFTFNVNDGTIDSIVPATVSINVTAHTISGNAGVAGATLSYTDGTPKTVIADGTGLYTFQVPTDWSGTVTPSKAGFTFTPANMTYSNVLADQTAQDYTTTGVTFTISGNAGSAGVTLSYTDGTPKTIISEGDGSYTIEIPYNWSGMVTPSLLGFGFIPGTRTYTNVLSNKVAQNYTTTTSRTYYVDKTNGACTDVGTVGSFTVPFCTIFRGAYLAVAGEIVHVLHGTYAETVTPRNNGSVGNPITFLADSGVTVTGQPQLIVDPFTAYPGFAVSEKNYIVIDGFTITQTGTKGIYVDASNHITISNNHITYAGASSTTHPYEQGIYLKATTYSTITGNTVDHNTCIGIRLLNGSDYNMVSNNTSFSNYSVVETDAAGIELTGASYNTVINNITFSNEDSGINVYVNSTTGEQSTDNLIIGNLSYENGDHGIDVNNSPYNTIVGNTVHGNGTVGINMEGETLTGSHHSTVVNNISAGNGFSPPSGSFAGNLRVDSASITGTTIDYNLFNRESAIVQILWNGIPYVSLAAFQTAVPTQEVHGLEGNPLFVAPVPSALRSTGVPYVGAGVVGNYYLRPGSPAIDSANADAPSEPLSDIDGNSRVDDPGTPDTGSGVRTYDDRGAYEFLPLGASLPTVTTQAVTAITMTTATGNGNITAIGEPNPTQHGVVWSTSADPTTADSKTTDGPVTLTGAFTSSITGLTPGTLYHVRAYATNVAGTTYGDDLSFTAYHIPAVTTSEVTAITTTTATGNGNVTDLGVPNPTQHGMVWATTANPTTANFKTTDGEVSATGAFTSAMTGLTPGTLYHVRAYVANAAATVYGEDFTFTTLLAPTVTTQAVTAITTTTATGNGNITVLGTFNPTEHGVVWAITANPTTADFKTTDGPVSATGAFTSAMTGLIPGTLYHVRAYATSAAGTSYGGDVTFTALIAPTITTQAVSSIGTTTAIGNGNVTALGVPNPIQHGVVWSTSANPTTADSKTTDGDIIFTGAFTSSITGLTPGNLYHVRAYATNTAGTSYGEDVSFTTLPSITGTTTPPMNAGTGANVPVVGSADWANPGYITADDTNYASVNLSGSILTSSYLEGVNYGFEIPSNATITGIVVTIGRHESGTRLGYFDVRDSIVRLLKGGVITGNNKAASGTEWPISPPVAASYGSTSDLWGATWTPEDINASNFGVVLSVITDVNRIAYVDYMQISVTYTVTMVASNTTVNCGSGTPVVTYGSDITCIATVVRGSGSKTPTGNVNWTTNISGNFVTSPCFLSGSAGTATCSVTYTPSSVGSGSHLITATYAGDPDFFTSNGDQTVTVNTKPITITPDAGQTKVFGAAEPLPFTYTHTALVGTDTISGTLGRVPGENVGTHAYTLGTLDAGTNYTLAMASSPEIFSITTKPITITPDAGQTKVFGAAEPLPFTYTHTALVGTDTISGTLGRVAGEIVGIHAYTLGSLNAGANYTLEMTSSPETFSIAAKPITITPDVGQTKVFGDSEPLLFTYTHTVLVGTDTISGTLDREAGENIGPYAYTLGSLNAGTNYTMEMTSSPENFSITAKPITITPDAGQTKVFGEGDPLPFTYTHTALIGADTISGILGRVAGENVGTHAYTLGSLYAGANYSLAMASSPETFSITTKPITITPDEGQTKVFGALDPLPFSYTHTALIGADTINGTLDREVGEDVGPYAFTLGSLDAGSNYTLEMASSPATFSITPATSTHSISLVPGWNLVSFTVQPLDTSITSVLSSIAGNYDLVYAWDAMSASNNWLIYDPSMPPFLNSLTFLDETMGFWIRMAAADTLEVTGIIPLTTNINFYTNAGGWNLVAYPSGENRPLPDALLDGEDYSLVYAYHANDPDDAWKLFDPIMPIFLNTLQELAPGWGYWVKVSAVKTWSVDY